MKLMAIIGSPRKGGNTELLVDQVAGGFRSKVDAKVEKFFVVDKKIEYCTGCLTCVLPSQGTGKCVIMDDMAEILERMKESDAFIFGTPNHMRTVTAPLLNFFARNGAPELTRVLCAMDMVWADEMNAGPYNVVFQRPSMMSAGGDKCRFQFRRQEETNRRGED